MGLQGANKSAHWDGWEIENPLELYCTCDISRHVVKLPIWHLSLRPYDEAAKIPDDKFFLCYFFSNLLFASDL